MRPAVTCCGVGCSGLEMRRLLALRLDPEVVAVGGDGDVAGFVGAVDGVTVEAVDHLWRRVSEGVVLSGGDDIDHRLHALQEIG